METNDQPITDVDFKEVIEESPPDFLTRTLREAGYPNPDAWEKHIDPMARNAVDIDQRLFLTNRSLGLWLSEIPDCGDNVIPRMFISERQTYENWKNIITEGIVPWLFKRFDRNTGKRIDAPTVVTPLPEGFENFASSTEPAELASKISHVANNNLNGPLTDTSEKLELPAGADPEKDQQAVVDAEDMEDPLFLGTFVSQQSFTETTDPKNFVTGRWAIVDGKKVVLSVNEDGVAEFKGLTRTEEIIARGRGNIPGMINQNEFGDPI